MDPSKLPDWLAPTGTFLFFLAVFVKPTLAWMRELTGWRWGSKEAQASQDQLEALQAWDQGFEACQAIRLILEDLEGRSDICRALLIKSEDSGGVPSCPTTPVFTTILDESFDTKLTTILPWRRVPVLENYYSDMLVQVFQKGTAEFVVAEMHQEDPVRTYYEAEGTQVSYVVRILASPAAMFYLSLHATCTDSAGQAELRTAGQVAARQLEEILAPYVDLVVKGAEDIEA